MTKQEIMERVEWYRLNGEYETYAIRVQVEPFSLGPINHVSKVWICGEETDEDLPGVCTVKAEAYQPGHYYGEHIAILGCYYSEMGEDVGEIIMDGAEVVEIIA